LKIVRDAKLDGIHWLCKHPSVLVVFEHLGYRLAIEVRFIKEVAAVVAKEDGNIQSKLQQRVRVLTDSGAVESDSGVMFNVMFAATAAYCHLED
jgi:hypothetical protein